jgi:HEAT repeat protein
LVKLARDPSADVRLAALLAIGRLGTHGAPAVPVLIGALRDSNVGPDGTTVRVREKAAEALGRIGPQAQEAVPGLTVMLADSDAFARQQAAIALWQITRSTNLALPALCEMLNGTNSASRHVAASALRRIARQTDLGPRLVAQLQSLERPRTGFGFISSSDREPYPAAIEQALSGAHPAIEPLLNLLHHTNTVVRLSAIMALEIASSATTDVPAIEETEVRMAVKELRILLNHPHAYTRQQAALTLWRIARDTNGLPALLARLHETRDRESARSILSGLAEFGPDAKAAVPQLLDVVGDLTRPESHWALDALRRIDPEIARRVAEAP